MINFGDRDDLPDPVGKMQAGKTIFIKLEMFIINTYIKSNNFNFKVVIVWKVWLPQALTMVLLVI
jgi:hypothetical protein